MTGSKHGLRRNSRILISGAGVAGPALAFWLTRAGHRVTLVERASALRVGGQAVDFRGPVHRSVLERMGLWDAIEARRTQPTELRLVSRAGAVRASMPAVMMSGDVEILRGDLCQLLYERTVHGVDYRFDECITALDESADSVAAQFERSAPETFDLVIGADGLHSGVRALAFGEERGFLRHQGYRIASFALQNPLPAEKGAACYSEPGRGACLYGFSETEARALLVYAAGPLEHAERNTEQQKRAVEERFLNMGWAVPSILQGLRAATDLYVDAIATAHVPRYATGRIALLGDAAWGGTLGGQGTSLGIVGAYALALALEQQTDPVMAFASYEARMRPYATRCQRGATHVGGFFAPRTRLHLGLRNAFYGALTSKLLSGVFEWLVKDAATDFELPVPESGSLLHT